LTKALELATEKKPNSPSPRSNKDISERQARGSIQPSETFASAALRYMACRRGCFAIEMATGITSNAASLAGLIMHVETFANYHNKFDDYWQRASCIQFFLLH
jgi:hypothetical protein